ncbi:LysR family transcriptional regulator [Conyzicola sp.]|uniref:LysR family transcriptional regulator n=1 Tax=Conyzicola sp. TaxID=1969404 RepID=UPI00398952BD
MATEIDQRLDLQSVRIVRAIAETGSITAAARALGYSQPAISQHLQRTEVRLGMALVTRVGRSVRLTEAGTVLARHALTITSAFDAAEGDLADLAGLRTGNVRLAAFPTASSTIVPRLLAALAAGHPGITVTYIEAQPPEAVQLLRDGGIDLAITFSYPGDRADPHGDSASGLTMQPLFTEEMVVVIPSRHPLTSHDVIDVAMLAGERWIAGCPRCRGHLLAVCEVAGFAPTITFETDNASAVMNMVASGLGVAMLPRLALATATLPVGAVIRPHSPRSVRSIQAIANDGARRVPSLAATGAVLQALDGTDWGLVAARG